MGNICVTLAAGGPNVVVQDCHDASQNADAQDKFFLCVALHVACRVTTALLCIAQLCTRSFARWGRGARRAAWRVREGIANFTGPQTQLGGGRARAVRKSRDGAGACNISRKIFFRSDVFDNSILPVASGLLNSYRAVRPPPSGYLRCEDVPVSAGITQRTSRSSSVGAWTPSDCRS